MENINKLQEQIKALLENASDKQLISDLASVNNTINAICEDTTSLKTENKELLDQYKDLIKHTSFKETPEKNPAQASGPVFSDYFK